MFKGGGGEAPINSLSLEKGKGQDGCAANVKGTFPAGLHEAMPAYLAVSDIPSDVLRAWELWQGLPVRFIKEGGGFKWLYSHTWAKDHRDQFEAFWRFQDGSDALWDWLSAHVSVEIGSHNLLKIWGNMDFSTENETLSRTSKALYGDALTLAVMNPKDIPLLKKNARILKEDVLHRTSPRKRRG